jgi:MFS family permease
LTNSNTRISKDAWITLAILSSIALITMYGETMIIPAIPDFIVDFGIAYNTSSWILASYLIAGAVMTPIAGKLSDIYGKKRVMVVIMVIYAFGTLIGGLSTSISVIIIARVIQGIGMSIFPIAFGVIRDKFPESKLAIGQAIFTAVFAGGSVVGLAVGATIIENYGWPATFLSIVPITLGLLVIILRFVHVSSDKALQVARQDKNSEKGEGGRKQKIDIKGAIALTVTISSFLIALTLTADSFEETAGVRQQDRLTILVLLYILAVTSLFIFLLIEKRAAAKNAAPLIDLSLLKDKILLPTNILIMTIGSSIFMIYQTLPILIRSPAPAGFNGGAVDVANVQLPFMVITLIVSVLSGFLISKLGNLKPTIIGCIISTIGFLILFFYHSTELEITLNLSVIAVGLSLAEVGAFNIALIAAPRHLSGISLGMTVLLFFIGMSVGPAISGLYLETFQHNVDGITFPSPLSYDMIFLTAVLISVSSVFLAVMITWKLRLTIYTQIE